MNDPGKMNGSPDVTAEYAPPDHPERAVRVAKMTAKAIVHSAEAVVESFQSLITAARSDVEQAVSGIEEFAKAARASIEEPLSALDEVAKTILEGARRHAENTERAIMNLNAVRAAVDSEAKKYLPPDDPIDNGAAKVGARLPVEDEGLSR